MSPRFRTPLFASCLAMGTALAAGAVPHDAAAFSWPWKKETKNTVVVDQNRRAPTLNEATMAGQLPVPPGVPGVEDESVDAAGTVPPPEAVSPSAPLKPEQSKLEVYAPALVPPPAAPAAPSVAAPAVPPAPATAPASGMPRRRPAGNPDAAAGAAPVSPVAEGGYPSLHSVPERPMGAYVPSSGAAVQELSAERDAAQQMRQTVADETLPPPPVPPAPPASPAMAEPTPAMDGAEYEDITFDEPLPPATAEVKVRERAPEESRGGFSGWWSRAFGGGKKEAEEAAPERGAEADAGPAPLMPSPPAPQAAEVQPGVFVPENLPPQQPDAYAPPPEEANAADEVREVPVAATPFEVDAAPVEPVTLVPPAPRARQLRLLPESRYAARRAAERAGY